MRRVSAFAYTELAEVSATLARLGEARSNRARLAYLEVVRAAIASSGGRELETVGDGVLSVFESPSDAIAFAGCVRRGCEREGRRGGQRLDVRIGVDVGETASDTAPAALQVAAVARAQELARAADSGSVLASGVVAALAAEGEARFVPAGLLALPSAAQPVSAFEVEWARAVVEQPPLPAELDAGGRRTRFVGRSAERTRLIEVWQSALAGERQLAVVAGEPGIGKARLVVEFARELHDQGATVLWGGRSKRR